MYHHDVYETPSQPEEVLSANRPPQLNETVCGCRRGYGDGGVSGEGDEGSEDDAASTLVGSDTSELGEQFPASSDEAAHNAGADTFPSVPANENGDEFGARIALFMSAAEGLRLGQRLMDRSFSPYQLEVSQDYDDTADSLINEPGSDAHSVVTTAEARSVHCISPGPGIGAWDERHKELPLDCPMDYHFSVRPLRLTPQHRYCRGLVASHLVLQDEITFMDMGNGLLRDGFRNSSHFHGR